MTPGEIKEVFDRLSTKLRQQVAECDAVDSWIRPELTSGFKLPRKATAEHRRLRDLSRTPWLGLVVTNVTQALRVDAFVGTDGRVDELVRLWHANGGPATQLANHRAMVAYGHSYSVVTPPARGEKRARIRFLSPRRVAGVWPDLGADPYPSEALELLSSRGKATRYRLRVPGLDVDLVQREDDGAGSEMDGLVVSGTRETGLSYVPVVRFSNQIDLDGEVLGEVTPFIPAAARINKTAYDRLLAQHYNSWKVKTATGLELPSAVDEDGDPTDRLDADAAEQLKLKLSQDDILVADDPQVRFGTLDATALDPFVNAWRADIEALAAVSQTPTYALTGTLANLDSDALAGARGPFTQKVSERQVSAGVSYSRTLRTAAHLSGWSEIAEDDLVRPTWQDMEIRSMSQAVDALGKAAQMLGIPERALWPRIPGVEASDVQEWERRQDEEFDRDPLQATYKRQAESTVAGVSGGQD
ncbi:phage portal protein [Corynebacterium sp. AOP12-C2-36]|uniref:phage portal protein n=1 Tax=Corynebacterium sp. AOP12-C2-36 TaxID=3457723 RepID=UPI004034436F